MQTDRASQARVQLFEMLRRQNIGNQATASKYVDPAQDAHAVGDFLRSALHSWQAFPKDPGQAHSLRVPLWRRLNLPMRQPLNIAEST